MQYSTDIIICELIDMLIGNIMVQYGGGMLID